MSCRLSFFYSVIIFVVVFVSSRIDDLFIFLFHLWTIGSLTNLSEKFSLFLFLFAVTNGLVTVVSALVFPCLFVRSCCSEYHFYSVLSTPELPPVAPSGAVQDVSRVSVLL